MTNLRARFLLAGLCLAATAAAAQAPPPAVLPPTAAEDLPLIDPAYGKCLNDAIAQNDDRKSSAESIARRVAHVCEAAFAAAVQNHTGGLTQSQAQDFRDQANASELQTIVQMIEDKRAGAH